MPVVMTFAERQGQIDEATSVLKDMIALNGEIESYRDTLIESLCQQYPDFAGIETAIAALLTQLDYLRDRAVEILGELTFTYDNEVRPTSWRNYYSVAVDAVYNTTKARLTAIGGTPFQVFDVGDIVEVTDAEDAANDGLYTVDARTDTTLDFTSNMAVDNAADTTLTVTLKSRA